MSGLVLSDSRFVDYLPARNLKATTVRNYRSSLERHLIPYFGAYDLAKLEAEPELVDRFVAAKLREGLAPKTVSNLLIDMGVVLKQAVRWRLIRSNPVRDAERPRVETPEMQVLTEAEIAALGAAYAELARDATEAERAWWQLAHAITFVGLGTALRRGELLALRWRDVRMLEGLLQLREALVAGKFTTPKSRSSRRTIELGPRSLALLQEHWQRSAYQGDEELVFGHPTMGTPLDASKLARVYLRPALKQAGIEKPFRPFHDLRHAALTHEAAAGNPQAYVQLKAGHSQGAITERYIHAAQVLFPGAAARGEDRMFGMQGVSQNLPKPEASSPSENRGPTLGPSSLPDRAGHFGAIFTHVNSAVETASYESLKTWNYGGKRILLRYPQLSEAFEASLIHVNRGSAGSRYLAVISDRPVLLSQEAVCFMLMRLAVSNKRIKEDSSLSCAIELDLERLDQ